MMCILIKKASKVFDAHEIEFDGFAMFPNNIFFLKLFSEGQSQRGVNSNLKNCRFDNLWF